MSYDIRLSVKVDGLNIYCPIAYPECEHPTYNLGKMFRACMDWDFSQSEKDESGVYRDCYYPCNEVIEHIEFGLQELICNRKEYEQYNPSNGWGSLDGAIRVLESARKCIYETVEDKNIPIEHLYFAW